MAKIKSDNSKYWWRCRETGSLTLHRWEDTLVITIKHALSTQRSSRCLGLSSQRSKKLCSRENRYVSVIWHCQELGSASCSSVCQWVNKSWYRPTLDYYSVVKKDQLLTYTAAWMNLQGTRPTGKKKKKQYPKNSISMSIIFLKWQNCRNRGEMSGCQRSEMRVAVVS